MLVGIFAAVSVGDIVGIRFELLAGVGFGPRVLANDGAAGFTVNSTILVGLLVAIVMGELVEP
jgi:hypothetical protein